MFREIKDTLRNIRPSRKQLSRFGIVLAALLLSLLIFKGELGLIRPVIGVAAAIFLILAMFVPGAMRPIWTAMMIVALPVGWVVFRAVLILFFYMVITPLGVGMRAFGYDPLRLKRGRAETYWQAFEENRNPDTIGL